MAKTLSKIALSATIPLLLAACGGGTDTGDPARARPLEGGIGGTGIASSLSMALAATPACGFSAVNVTVQGVRVHQNGDAAASGPGWVDIVLPQPQRVDLLGLAGGTVLNLGETTLPPGTYRQLRLLLVANDPAHPLADSVVPAGDIERPLTTPDAQESSVRTPAQIVVAANQQASYTVTLDACRAIVSNGSGRWLLKPMMSVATADGASIAH